MFSDSRIKMEMNNTELSRKHQIIWEKNTILNNMWIKEEIKRKMRIYLKYI